MKYLQADRTNYTKGRKCTQKFGRTPLYIVVHYTGRTGQTALNNGTYFSGKNRGASAHYFIGKDGIVQTVSLGDTAWHCGKSYGSGQVTNDNTIGIELCCEIDTMGQWYIPPTVLNNFYNLVGKLKRNKTYSIIDIFRHYDITGKLCPVPLLDESRWHRVKKHVYSL